MTPARSRHTIVAHDPLHAVRLVFALNGLVLASWVPHIPAVATRLGLTPGALGRVLLGMAVGSFVGIPLAGATIGRVGSRVVVGIAAVCFCLAGVWPVRAPSSTILVLVLTCFGAANGAMDISMNAQAAAVERHLGRPVMSSMHGMWSLGGLIGAAIAAAALWAGVSPPAHMLAVCALALVGIGVALMRFLPSTFDLQAAADMGSGFAKAQVTN